MEHVDTLFDVEPFAPVGVVDGVPRDARRNQRGNADALTASPFASKQTAAPL
jgi:hypothetical protein